MAPLYSDPPEEEATRIGTLGSLAPKSTARDKAYLIVLAGDNAGSMFRVDEGPLVIGRASGVDVRLTDDGVSRKHAMVTTDGETITLRDLGSANGTQVNDMPVDGDQVLADGDKIRIGSTTILKFTYHDDLEEDFQQRLYDAALRDALTKAFNRKHLLERFETELSYARRHHSQLALVMFDVDHFKKINDTWGHLAGDAVLVRLARLTAAAVRAEDIFARYGGEEFAILCRGIDVEKARQFAERLRQQVESTKFEYDQKHIPVTISLGVAVFPDVPAAQPDQLIRAADEALYASKRGGRNCVSVRGQL